MTNNPVFYWLLAMIAAGCCALFYRCDVVHTTDADGKTTAVCTEGGYAVECDCAKFGRKP